MPETRESRVAAARAARERHQAPTATRHLKTSEVKYLAFEGGGSKGITYLGAIEALEELKILPLGKPAGTNQIRGLAGSSAGAITALALALGYTADELRKLLADQQRFNAFFDGPAPGLYRVINQKYELEAVSDPGVDASVIAARRAALGTVPKLISALLPASENPIVTAIAPDVEGYLYNLIFDRGLFPGFAVPEFFMSLLREFVDEVGADRRAAARVKGDGSYLTFEQLKALTKLDVVMTGVNVTTKQIGKWSPSLSPAFPVALAATISMNIPMLFKPVRLDELSIGTAPRSAGFWVDGGILNNFPLHAFDDNADNPRRSPTPGLSGLHPNVLAIRLTPGFPPRSMLSAATPDPLRQPMFAVLLTYLTELADVLTSPAEEGQIRSPEERNQIVELFTGDLALTEFTPPQSKWEWPVKNARQVVSAYFAPQK